MNRPSGMQRCPRPVKGDTGNRAEQIAICIVLALELGATYHKPEEGYRRRTPDWLVTLRDGRQVALEVTGKRTDWKYEDLDGIRVGGLSMCRANGDRKSLDETLRRKMKDKYERGQLAGDREKWLCIQLDEAAGFELDALFRSLRTIVILPKPSYAYDMFHSPDFSQEMATAANYGYDQVWCITQSWDGPGTTLVLRLFSEEKQWTCFCLSHQFHFEPPCHNHYPHNHHGYIATRLNRQTQP